MITELNSTISFKEFIAFCKKNDITFLINKKFNFLTLLEFLDIQDYRFIKVRCQCDCGKEKIGTLYSIICNDVQSCGCNRYGIHQSELDKALCADHNHTTKIFRFLLCNSCNLVMGRANDNPSLLHKLASLLEDAENNQLRDK